VPKRQGPLRETGRRWRENGLIGNIRRVAERIISLRGLCKRLYIKPLDRPVSSVSCSRRAAGNKQSISSLRILSQIPLKMATFAPIPYTYVSTAARCKNTAARSKAALKHCNILDNVQPGKLSGAALDGPQLPTPAVVDSNGGCRSRVQDTGTFYGGSDDDDEDGSDIGADLDADLDIDDALD